MKVAVCISGAMSKLSGRLFLPNQLYSSSEYVDYTICFNSLNKHLILANPNYHFDFFIHSWNPDLKSSLNKLYKPINSLYEDNNIFKDEILKSCKNNDDYGGISRSLSIKKSIDLMLSNNIIYNIIIIYRPDLIILKDMIIDNYIIDDNKIYVNKFSDGNGDFHFIMNYNSSIKFKELYNSLNLGNIYGTHFWIKNFVLNFLKKQIVEDEFVAGKDQEVIRKLFTNENVIIDKFNIIKYKEKIMENKYTNMQRDYYNSTADIMAIENHRGHDSNPDYYGLLLSDITSDPLKWKHKICLDFGCGIGRNIDNLLKIADWSFADGCDLSEENIKRADLFLKSQNHSKYSLYTTSGTDLSVMDSDRYDFVMSTIVLQHIAVYDIRISLLKDIYRVLSKGGLFSFQMAQYKSAIHGNFCSYFENKWDVSGTNGAFDVSVDDPVNVVKDLENIGFTNISFEVRQEWDAGKKEFMDPNKSKWLYFKASK